MRLSKKLITEHLPLFLILLVSAVTRVVSAFVAVGESGGDFYNYLIMAKSFLEGGSIFIEKRLPVYALLLIPGHLFGHPLGWARILGIVLALLTLYFLYKFLQDLRLPKAVVLTLLILLSLQPTFFLFSIRPLSHTLFDFEVIFSLFLFYRVVSLVTRGLQSSNILTTKQLLPFVLFGLVLGLTAMTRHEGFLVAGVLLLCLIVLFVWKTDDGIQRTDFRRQTTERRYGVCSLFFAILTFATTVLPWFISNYQRFGNPFYTQYQTDAGLNVAYTSEKLLGNFLTMRDIFLGMWGSLGFVSIKEPWLILTRVKSVGEIITILTIVSMFIGLWVFVRRLKWSVVPILLIFITQALFLTVVQPWPRHAQHLFFLPALLLPLGLYWFLSLKAKKLLAGVLLTILLMPVWVYLIQADLAALNGYVRGGQKTLPLLRSVETLQRQFPKGAVLVSEKFKTEWSDESSLINYYLGNRITYNLSDNPDYALDYNGTIQLIK